MRCDNCKYSGWENEGEMMVESCGIFGAYNEEEVFENELGMGCKYRMKTLDKFSNQNQKDYNECEDNFQESIMKQGEIKWKKILNKK